MSNAVNEGLGSKENVALQLARDIAQTERMIDDSENYRKRMLNLYAECLVATKGHRSKSGDGAL